LKLGAKEGVKENTIGEKGDPEKTTDPKVATVGDPIPDVPDPPKSIEDNSTPVLEIQQYWKPTISR
jgi:hypothetical protein